ncbi:MAG: universal stress protein [Dehalococcoidia bacterium]
MANKALLEEPQPPIPAFAPYDRVLTPLDGSTLAETALPLARLIATRAGIAIKLIRALEGRAEAEAAVTHLRGIAESLGADYELTTPDESVADWILEQVDARTLLVMATHGRSGVGELIAGSVAMSLVRESYLPVLLVGPGVTAPLTAPNTVVVALDGGPFAEEILPFAASFARWLGAEVQLVQALRGNQGDSGPPGDVLETGYVMRKARELRNATGVSASYEILHGGPVSALTLYMAGRTDAILAMTTHARVGVAANVFGSVTAGCLRNSGVPVLTCQPLDV